MTMTPARALRVAAVAFTAVPLAVLAIGPQRSPAVAPYRAGELIVKYRPDKSASNPSVQSMLSRHGLQARASMFDGRYQRLRLPSALDVPGALAMLAADPAIEYAEPNYLRRRHAVTPNDPRFSSQWGLSNTGQPNFVDGGPAGTPGADLNLRNAWDLDSNGIPDRTGRGLVTIAIIDDAFETTHPDLAANMVAGYDFVQGDSNPAPADASESHGTAVAGAAAAVGGNGEGIAGAAWNERIMPLRFGFDVATQIEAFDFARLRGAQIINASFGGPGYSRAEVEAIQALNQAGILFVASAGNQDSNLDLSGATYPANYALPNVLAVAATNRQDGLASFSTYGPTTVPLAAPGLQIVTTTLNGGYTTTGISGTSFSAPYVAGIAALIRDYLPAASPREIKARLINASEAGLDGSNPVDRRTAGGRLDARNALSLSAGPSLVIRPQQTGSYVPDYDSGGVNVPVREAVVVDDGGNGRLDPGEATDLVIALENLWLTATNVRATLTASDGVGVGVGAVAYGTIASGASQTARFPVSVPQNLSGYRPLAFTLSITADGGYAATRQFLLDSGRLVNGQTVTQSFQPGLYDEFHTWVIDVPSSGGTLTVQSTGDNDIDIFVRRGAAAQYSVDLDAAADAPADTSEPFYYVNVPEAQRGDRSLGGDEQVSIANAPAGSYFVTVINYDRTPSATYTLRAQVSGGSVPGTTGGGSGGTSGGGATAPWALALLAFAALAKRRGRGLPAARKAC